MKECPLPASDLERKHGKFKKKMWRSHQKSKHRSDSGCRNHKKLQEQAGGTAKVAVMQTAYSSYGPTTEEPVTFQQ